MKKRFLFVGIFILICVSALIIPIDDQSNAYQGCFKERNDLSSQNWYKNGLSFEDCRRLNRLRDDDDLHRPSGYIFWDSNC